MSSTSILTATGETVDFAERILTDRCDSCGKAGRVVRASADFLCPTCLRAALAAMEQNK